MSSEQIKNLADKEAEAGHTEQAAALSDGVVTFAEYDEAFGRLAGCLSERGFTVTSPVMSPVTGNRYEYSADFGTRDRESALSDLDDCESNEWKSIAMAYSFSTPDVMEKPLRQAIADCLTEMGVESTGEETNVEDFVNLPGVEPDAVLSCAQTEGHRLYPGLPSLSIGY